MANLTTWGLSATILAPAADILRFAAYHLEAGAQRLYIYLDAENVQAFEALKAHPKVRVQTCDAAWWDKIGNGRPKKHQVRQTMNATHAYNRKAEVDWLIHMDADEFLVSAEPVAEILGTLASETLAARIRPMEALSGDGTAFKAFVPNGPDRNRIVQDIYPTFGAHLKGGFLSHLAGKVFVRTGLTGVRVQIHNAFQNEIMIPTEEQQAGIDLAHMHAKTWDQWHAAYRYRLAQGSYRAELAPNKPRDKGGMSMHDLFQQIEAQDPESGLKAFFDEVCADTPRLRSKLAEHGLLRQANLDLDGLLSTHFPHVSL